MIMALGTLAGMVGGVVTASPALAGRGHKWEFMPAPPAVTLPASWCGFKVRLTTPVNKEFIKVLKASDGSMTFLYNRLVPALIQESERRKGHHRERVGVREVYRTC